MKQLLTSFSGAADILAGIILIWIVLFGVALLIVAIIAFVQVFILDKKNNQQ